MNLSLGIENPYRCPAGRELDAFIHQSLKDSSSSLEIPDYSTNETAARMLTQVLKQRYRGKFSVGRTKSTIQPFYARYETRYRQYHEVLADSYALAVSRLSMLLIQRLTTA